MFESSIPTPRRAYGETNVNTTRKTILVIDGTDDITELTATVLRLSGYNVVTARDGSEALDMALKCMPDLILMDLSMPVMSRCRTS